MRSLLDPSAYDQRTSCEVCGANGLEPDEPCDCFSKNEEDNEFLGEGVALSDVPSLSRDEFFAMLGEDPMYSGLVDPDDQENILIATILAMDLKYQSLYKENAELKKRLGIDKFM